jgi:phospholipase/carboxylesterase
MHKTDFAEGGVPAEKATGALVLLHGRGASAEDILQLSKNLTLPGFNILAPRATHQSWYPYSFLAPAAKNEPWLGSALSLIKELTDQLISKGLPASKIFFLGFSQGACLALEFAARNAKQWGGIIAFSGGLIGETINEKNYSGNFEGTPVFIGNSDTDPHIPVERCRQSAIILGKMKAVVTLRIYPGMGHSVNRDELTEADKILNPA